MSVRWRWLPVLAAAASLAVASARAGDRPMPAASDGRNAWVVVERTRATGTERVLLHHSVDMGCDCVREAMSLPRAPEALAAAGSRLWMVLSPIEAGGRRDVYSLALERNPATGAFYSGAMLIHPSLPGEGELLGIAPLGDGLLALRAGAPLEVLGSLGWSSVADAPSTAGMRLATVAGSPALVGPDARVRLRMQDGTWEAQDLRTEGAGFLGFIDGARRPAALVRLDRGMRAIDILRNDAALRMSVLEAPDRASAVLGLGDAFVILVPTGEGGAAIRRIDPVGGALGPAVVLSAQRSDASLWACGGALGFALLGIGSGLLLRRTLRLKSPDAERR